MRSTKLIGMAAMVAMFGFVACGDNGGSNENDRRTGPPGGGGAPAATEESQSQADMVQPGDIELGEIDESMVAQGKSIYEVKCQACHSTGPNRVVGPGWKGITERREPHWIMNMILNVDVMLATDPEAQRQLEECLVRMPNQGLDENEGRQVLEFMRTL